MKALGDLLEKNSDQTVRFVQEGSFTSSLDGSFAQDGLLRRDGGSGLADSDERHGAGDAVEDEQAVEEGWDVVDEQDVEDE